MTQSWFNLEMAIFPPTWSISTEWFFYLAFIPMTALVIRLRKPALVFIVFGIATIIGLSITFALWRAPIIAFANHWFWHGEAVSFEPWGWSNYF